MGCENFPIQVNVHCREDGSLHPLRFRLQDHAAQMHTVQAIQVIDIRDSELSGERAIFYLCKAMDAGKLCLFELKYDIEKHRWFLFRQIY